MTELPDLNEREREILHAVVHSYITSAEPVGSRTVVKRFGMELSPATVRNVMADLEDAGFLQQLHTSSGRVPTELGYRYYVNHLMRVQRLTLEERDRIEREYQAKLNDADAVLRQTSHLLALVTHQAGVAEAPSESAAVVQRVELLPLWGARMAVLIVDSFGRLRTMHVELEEALDAEALGRLNQFLNDQLRGATADSLAAAIEQRLRSYFDEQRRLAELALRVLKLLPRQTQGQLFLEGAAQLFEQPEFSDIARAREVMGLFEERERLVEVLREALAQSSPGKGAVFIGPEGTGLDGLSVVSSPYEVNGKTVGVVGVIGPRRMPYPRLTAIVEHTAGLVGRMLTRLARS